MSLLWVVGPIAAVAGAVLTVVGLRRTAVATEEIVASVRAFGAVGESLAELRSAAEGTATRAGRIRQRSDRQ